MKSTSGFTLLELLISLFIFSIALLGIDALQMTSLHAARGLYYFQQAAMFSQNMAEYLHAHQGESTGYEEKWLAGLQFVLPHGVGRVSGSYPDYCIIVQWGSVADSVCDHNQSGTSGCVVLKVKI